MINQELSKLEIMGNIGFFLFLLLPMISLSIGIVLAVFYELHVMFLPLFFFIPFLLIQIVSFCEGWD